jgi:signal transduction histidine kinase
MSYRAFKRLLGETSLERKCRFLFGAFILALITASFWLYARQTEHLAYDQIGTACRMLVVQLMDTQLTINCQKGQSKSDAKTTAAENQRINETLKEFRSQWVKRWPAALQGYEYAIIKGTAERPDQVPDQGSWQQLKVFRDNKDAHEETQLNLSTDGKLLYYAAIRATDSCIKCHQHQNVSRDDLVAMIKIEVLTVDIAKEFHANRAWLISNALVTAILIMVGSYLIVRYVIVKPVKHLKEVSDAISAGALNVRAEIQTGDEFEDLSHAFNRMLRNLVAMQDRLRKVNNDLDHKVDELAQANLALFESNRLKSDFLARVSHELKTPLHSILGFGEVLADSKGLTDKQQRWVTNIRTSGDQLRNLINDILDLAKIEAGKMQVVISTFDVVDACQGVLTMFQQMAEKKNIDLRGIFAATMPRVRQDMIKLQQILNNLISNAIKFTPEGGRVTLKSEQAGSYVLLIVQDTGVGIAPEEQDLVFDKFRQAGNLMTRQHGGTGLGLSIVRELAKLLGGEVTLQSELGRGSTFTVRLPLALSDETRLEVDMTLAGVDLARAQRVDVRMGKGEEG